MAVFGQFGEALEQVLGVSGEKHLGVERSPAAEATHGSLDGASGVHGGFVAR